MVRYEDIHLSFGPKTVLNGINVEFQEGETAVIIGASGSGKSMLLKILLGLIEPTSGEVFIDGESMTRASPAERSVLRRSMGMVFQEGALFDSLTVRGNVGYRIIEEGLPAAEVDERVKKKLDFVGLAGTMHSMPGELSGGMKRRVAIARALVGNPRLMLFDEPTTGLDPIVAKKITDHINDLSEEGITSIIVTHELPYAYRVADRILLLREGKFVFSGTVDEFKQSADPYLTEFRDY